MVKRISALMLATVLLLSSFHGAAAAEVVPAGTEESWRYEGGVFYYGEDPAAYDLHLGKSQKTAEVDPVALLDSETETHTWTLYPVLADVDEEEAVTDKTMLDDFFDQYIVNILVDEEVELAGAERGDSVSVKLSAGESAKVGLEVLQGEETLSAFSFLLQAVFPRELTLSDGTLTMPLEGVEEGCYFSLTLEQAAQISTDCTEDLRISYWMVHEEETPVWSDFYRNQELLCDALGAGKYVFRVLAGGEDISDTDAVFAFAPVTEDAWFGYEDEEGDVWFYYNGEQYGLWFSESLTEDFCESMYFCESETDSRTWSLYPVLIHSETGDLCSEELRSSFLEKFSLTATAGEKTLSLTDDGAYQFTLAAGESVFFRLQCEELITAGRNFYAILPTEIGVENGDETLELPLEELEDGDETFFTLRLDAPVKISAESDPIAINIDYKESADDKWTKLYQNGDFYEPVLSKGTYILRVQNDGEEPLTQTVTFALDWDMGDWYYAEGWFWYEEKSYWMDFFGDPEEPIFESLEKYLKDGESATWTLYPMLVREEDWEVAEESVLESFLQQYEVVIYGDRDRDEPLTPSKDGFYSFTLDAGTSRTMVLEILEEEQWITGVEATYRAVIPQPLSVENNTLVLPIKDMADETKAFFSFTLTQDAQISTDFGEELNVFLTDADSGSERGLYAGNGLRMDFLHAGNYYLRVESFSDSTISEDMTITLETDSENWGWVYDQTEKLFLYQGTHYEVRLSTEPDALRDIRPVPLKEGEEETLRLWPVLVNLDTEQDQYADLMDSFLEVYEVIVGDDEGELTADMDGGYSVTLSAGDSVRRYTRVYDRSTNRQVRSMGQRLVAPIMEEVSVKDGKLSLDVPTQQWGGRSHIAYFSVTLDQPCLFTLDSLPDSLPEKELLELLRYEDGESTRLLSSDEPTEPFRLSGGTYILVLETYAELEQDEQMVLCVESAITNETKYIGDSDYASKEAQQKIWPGNGQIELEVDGETCYLGWYRRNHLDYIYPMGRNSSSMLPEDRGGSYELFPALISMDAQGNRVERLDLMDELVINSYEMLYLTEEMTPPAWFAYTDPISGWTGRAYSYDFYNLGEWWMLAHVTFRGEEYTLSCAQNLTEELRTDLEFDDLEELNAFLETLSGAYYVEQWVEAYEKEHGVKPTQQTEGYPTDEVLRKIAIGYALDGSQQITYDLTLKDGDYTGIIEVPGDMLYQVTLRGETKNGENLVTLEGSLHCNGSKYFDHPVSVRNVDFRGAGKRVYVWPEDADEALAGQLNYGFYGEGGGSYASCSFTDYWHAVDCSNGVLRFGGSNSTFMDNHIAIYCWANDDNGGNTGITRNHFENNDCAIMIMRLYLNLYDKDINLTPKDYRIRNNTFVNNGFSILNFTGRILYANGNLFLINNQPSVAALFTGAYANHFSTADLNGNTVSTAVSTGLMKDSNGQLFIADDASAIQLPDGGTAEYLFTTAMVEDKTVSIQIIEEAEENQTIVDREKGVWHFGQTSGNALSAALFRDAAELSGAEEDAWDAGIDIQQEDGVMMITVHDSPVLQQNQPVLEVRCAFDGCVVYNEDGEAVPAVLSGGKLSFPVSVGGTYTVVDAADPGLTSGTVDADEEAWTFTATGISGGERVLVCAYDSADRCLQVREITAANGVNTAETVSGAARYHIFLLAEEGMTPLCEKGVYTVTP